MKKLYVFGIVAAVLTGATAQAGVVKRPRICIPVNASPGETMPCPVRQPCTPEIDVNDDNVCVVGEYCNEETQHPEMLLDGTPCIYP